MPDQQAEDENWDQVEPLPSWLLALTSPALDLDEAVARRAADLIHSMEKRLAGDLTDLENMERALALSERSSNRARDARTKIQSVITGFTGIISNASQARDALVFHWRPTPP